MPMSFDLHIIDRDDPGQSGRRSVHAAINPCRQRQAIDSADTQAAGLDPVPGREACHVISEDRHVTDDGLKICVQPERAVDRELTSAVFPTQEKPHGKITCDSEEYFRYLRTETTGGWAEIRRPDDMRQQERESRVAATGLPVQKSHTRQDSGSAMSRRLQPMENGFPGDTSRGHECGVDKLEASVSVSGVLNTPAHAACLYETSR